MLPAILILIAMVGIGFGLDGTGLLEFNQEPPPTTKEEVKGELIKPDGFTVLPTPVPTVGSVKGVYWQTPTPTPDPDPIVSCNVHANCGGGNRQMRQSECNQSICCGFNNGGWQQMDKQSCKSAQEAETKALLDAHKANAEYLLARFKADEARSQAERQQLLDSYQRGIQKTLNETDAYLNDMNKRISGYQGEFDVKVQKSLDDMKKAGTIVEPTPIVTPPKENNPGDPVLWNLSR